MWPFGNRLRDQDAVEKYRRWLRRWLLGPGRFVAAGTIAVAVLAGIVWASVNAWNSSSAPAINNGAGMESVTGGLPAAPDFPTGKLEDKQVKQLQPETNTDFGKENSLPDEEKDEPADVSAAENNPDNEGLGPSPVLPVNGRQISAYGYHYSPLYGDFRFHSGITLQAAGGSEVYPCLPGKVVEISFTEGRGYTVTLDHGDGLASKYQGLDRVTAEKNSHLTTVDSLGRAGAGDRGEIFFTLTRNGNSVDPAPYLSGLRSVQGKSNIEPGGSPS